MWKVVRTEKPKENFLTLKTNAISFMVLPRLLLGSGAGAIQQRKLYVETMQSFFWEKTSALAERNVYTNGNQDTEMTGLCVSKDKG